MKHNYQNVMLEICSIQRAKNVLNEVGMSVYFPSSIIFAALF
jgi:hypothetical protein